MGMYDEVEFHAGWPGYPIECRHFQTKALDRCLDRYLVTKEGLLFLVGSVLEDDLPEGAERPQDAPVAIDFSGDMRLLSDEKPPQEYTAHFAHGKLEWIRAAESP